MSDDYLPSEWHQIALNANKALERNPNDADALAVLGSPRLRAGLHTYATSLARDNHNLNQTERQLAQTPDISTGGAAAINALDIASAGTSGLIRRGMSNIQGSHEGRNVSDIQDEGAAAERDLHRTVSAARSQHPIASLVGGLAGGAAMAPFEAKAIAASLPRVAEAINAGGLAGKATTYGVRGRAMGAASGLAGVQGGLYGAASADDGERMANAERMAITSALLGGAMTENPLHELPFVGRFMPRGLNQSRRANAVAREAEQKVLDDAHVSAVNAAKAGPLADAQLAQAPLRTRSAEAGAMRAEAGASVADEMARARLASAQGTAGRQESMNAAAEGRAGRQGAMNTAASARAEQATFRTTIAQEGAEQAPMRTELLRRRIAQMQQNATPEAAMRASLKKQGFSDADIDRAVTQRFAPARPETPMPTVPSESPPPPTGNPSPSVPTTRTRGPTKAQMASRQAYAASRSAGATPDAAATAADQAGRAAAPQGAARVPGTAADVGEELGAPTEVLSRVQTLLAGNPSRAARTELLGHMGTFPLDLQRAVTRALPPAWVRALTPR